MRPQATQLKTQRGQFVKVCISIPHLLSVMRGHDSTRYRTPQAGASLLCLEGSMEERIRKARNSKEYPRTTHLNV